MLHFICSSHFAGVLFPGEAKAITFGGPPPWNPKKKYFTSSDPHHDISKQPRVSGEGRHTTHLLKCVRLLSTSQTDWRQSSDMLSDISFDILSDISSDIVLTFCLAYLLTFCLAFFLTYLLTLS